MSDKPATAREALIAELLGDVHRLIDRVDLVHARLDVANSHAQATADTLREATLLYRSQVDDMVARLRSETASIIAQTTEHAARSLVGQQTETLQKAATAAIRQALTPDVLRQNRLDRTLAIAMSAAVGAVVAAGLIAAALVLRG